MARPAKLTIEQWADARKKWEDDLRPGFDWLCTELGGVVSRQAISKKAHKDGWTKGGVKVAQPFSKPKKESCATQKESKKKVAQPSRKKELLDPVDDENSLKEVNQIISHLHGNSKYDQSFNKMARRLCLLGATNADLAEFFEVSESTLNLWKLKHPEFSDSIRKGKMVADANMAHKLYHRGVGYSHPETKVFCNNGEIITAEVMKHYPPDTKANLAWLYNRQPEKWRNNVNVQGGITITQIPWDELREIRNQSREKALQKHREVIEGRYQRLGITKEYQSD